MVLPVMVEFDTGMGRCGVQSPGEARTLARSIHSSKGLSFIGLMTHPHNEKSDAFVEETKGLLIKDGVPVSQVSYGGTAGLTQVALRKQLNEYRAGVYVYGDRDSIAKGAMKLEDCSLRVLATVVSRPTTERVIVDAGSKALTSDLLGLSGYGFIVEYPEARFYEVSEEHGWLDFSKCAKRPWIGERVSIVPNHACVVSNLYDRMVGLRGEQVEVIWRVAARGASQ